VAGSIALILMASPPIVTPDCEQHSRRTNCDLGPPALEQQIISAHTGPPVCVQRKTNDVFSFRSAGELKRTVPTKLACLVSDTMGRPPRLTLFGRSMDTVAVTSPCTFRAICQNREILKATSVCKLSYPD